MLSCWNEKANQRPTFADLRTQLGHMLSGSSHYVDLNINLNHPCYHVPDDRNDATPTGGLLQVHSPAPTHRSGLGGSVGSISVGAATPHRSTSSVFRPSASPEPKGRSLSPMADLEKPLAGSSELEGRRPCSMLSFGSSISAEDQSGPASDVDRYSKFG